LRSAVVSAHKDKSRRPQERRSALPSAAFCFFPTSYFLLPGFSCYFSVICLGLWRTISGWPWKALMKPVARSSAVEVRGSFHESRQKAQIPQSGTVGAAVLCLWEKPRAIKARATKPLTRPHSSGHPLPMVEGFSFLGRTTPSHGQEAVDSGQWSVTGRKNEKTPHPPSFLRYPLPKGEGSTIKIPNSGRG
jgi:hypothetical protein